MMKMAVAKTIAAVAVVVWCIPVSAEPLPERFSFVAKQIEQARSRVNSVSYRVSVEAEDILGELGRRHITTSWDIIEKGPLRAATLKTSMTFADGRTPGQEYSTRAVLGESYFAMRLNQNSMCDLYVYESQENMSEKASGQVRSYAGISIMSYGFGDGDLSFSAPYLHNPAISRWEVAEVAGEYHLKRYAVATPERTHPESLWVVDPKQGWLITKLVRYDSDGRVFSDLKVKGAEVAKGVFLAAHVEHAFYDSKMSPETAASLGLKNPDEPYSKRTMTFTEVAVNPDLADERFTLGYLGLPDGSLVQRHQPNGAMEPMGCVNNQVLALRAVAELMAEKRRLAKEAGGKTATSAPAPE